MQKDWYPDGWLGIILGAKNHINFTLNFEQCMGQLGQEIDQVLDKDSDGKLKTLRTDTESGKVQLFSQEAHRRFKLDASVLNWSEREVQVWLREKNVHPVISANLSSFSGKVLGELFLMKEQTPGFFYQSVSITRGEINADLLLKDLALFSHELRRLFIGSS